MTPVKGYKKSLRASVSFLLKYLDISKHAFQEAYLSQYRVRGLLIGQLKVNNRPLFTLLYYTKLSNLIFFYKNNGKTWLSVLILEVITYHLSCYSEMFE